MYEMVADAIENLQSVVPVLKNMGVIHSKLVTTRGFLDCYWFVFEDSTLLVFRKYLKKVCITLTSKS